jgi:hypothetical protein
MAARKASGYVLFAFGSVLPAFLLEFILVHASGREASVANVILPIFLTFAGLLWAKSGCQMHI